MIMMMKEGEDLPVAVVRAKAAKAGAGAAMKKKDLLHVAIVPLPAAQAEAAPIVRVVDSPACQKKKYAV